MDPNGAECLQMQILGLCTKFRDSWGPVFIFTFLPNWVPRRDETKCGLLFLWMSFSISKLHPLWIEVTLWADFFTVFITLETKRLTIPANQMSVPPPLLMWKKTHASTNFMSRLRKKIILSASQKVSRLLWKSNLRYSSLENTIGIYPEPTEPS
jgi:hypothetical protein